MENKKKNKKKWQFCQNQKKKSVEILTPALASGVLKLRFFIKMDRLSIIFLIVIATFEAFLLYI